MAEIAALLGQLRGETPPAVPYDMKNPLSRTDNAASPEPAVPEREPKGAALRGTMRGPTSEERSDERGGNSPRQERPEASAGDTA
jgi:hypothetical protein